MQFQVERGNGTSFAVATTAGAAALWVSYHGWATLARKYGAGHIAAVFKQILQATCRTPRGWDTREYGPGIVDAKALLEAPLPDSAPARKLRDSRRPAVAADTTGLETIVHLLPGVPRTRIESALASMLNVPDRDLPSVLQDHGDEIAFQLVMHRPLLEAVGRAATGAAGRKASRSSMARQLAARGVSAKLMRQLRRPNR
jgi:hypothetical protein